MLFHYRNALFLILFCLNNSIAIDKMKVQHAGEIGNFAMGFGKNFTSYYSLDFLYGVVPESMNNEKIETYALKNNFDFAELVIEKIPIIFYTGVTVFWVPGKKYETTRNEEYPENYYPIGSVRGQLFIGINANLKKYFLYFENGINDIVLMSYLNNPREIDPAKYMSLAIGFGYKF